MEEENTLPRFFSFLHNAFTFVVLVVDYLLLCFLCLYSCVILFK